MKSALILVLAVGLRLTCGAQTTLQDWQVTAVKKYPALGVSGSPFNVEFVNAYKERQKSDPSFFTNPEWPLLLADELAGKAGGSPAPAAAPSAGAAQPAPSAATAVPGARQGQNPAQGAAGTGDYEAPEIPALAGLDAAKFRWWSPANTQVRGVLVLIPGRSGDGRGMAGSGDWQALATRLQFGIMACFLLNPKSDIGTYQFDTTGAVAGLIDKALKTLMEQNSQTLKNPPLVFWGMSAGGNVSQSYISHHADRVVAAVLVRATAGIGSLARGKADVPILDFVGGKDKPEWVDESLSNYKKGRAVNAAWTLALNPNEGHEIGRSQPLAFAHITAAVNLRLPPPSGFSSDTIDIKRVEKQKGWLGNPESYDVAEYDEFQGSKKDATWLLDETTAKAWQEYLRGK